MNWATNQMVFQNYLFVTPITINGTYVRSSYDPSIMTYNGENWIAWECTPHYSGLEYVSSCVAPLLPDLSGIDQTRFSVPVRGYGTEPIQPRSNDRPGECQHSAVAQLRRSPIYLLGDRPQYAVNTASNPMVSRGAMLQQDMRGKFWIFGAGSNPVQTEDPNLTTVVRDVVSGDTTADHVFTGSYRLCRSGRTGTLHDVQCRAELTVRYASIRVRLARDVGG